MKSKVLLINPPTLRDLAVTYDNYFPLGLLSLATVLKDNGIDSRMLDVNNYYYMKEYNQDILDKYIEDRLYSYVEEYNPDIIGIGCLFTGAFKSLKVIASRLKSRFPKIPIVIGGIHPTIFARDILKKYNCIDYVVIGEGESSFLELVKSLVGGDNPSEETDGLAFRHKQEIKLNPKRKFINKLDQLPFVDYSMLDDIEEYHNMDTSDWYSPKNLRIAQPFPIVTSRSCPHRCPFCSMWLVHGPKIRYRSPDNVLAELEYLYKEYGVNYFRFMDDNLTFDRQRILDICRGIVKRNMNIQFDTPNGVAVNGLDKEVVEAMAKAGMTRVSIAIESGSEYIRNKIMRKNLSREKIYEVAGICAEYEHLFITGYFIIGMPQETRETLTQTYEMIKSLPLDNAAVNFVTPYPGTELFTYCIKQGLLPYRAEDYVDIEYLHYASKQPHFEPFELKSEDLINFKEMCRDYFLAKRKRLGLRAKFPLRYKKEVASL